MLPSHSLLRPVAVPQMLVDGRHRDLGRLPRLGAVGP